MAAILRQVFEIDADIRRAATLPAAVYRDQDWYDRMGRSVLRRTWHAFPEVVPGGADEVCPFSLADDALLLTRNESGLSCVSNVCTHRGNLLVDARTRGKSIRCGYHGRRFALDGRMTHAPEFEAAQDFPSDTDNLPAVAVKTWHDLAFVSPDPAHTLDELIAPLGDRVGFLNVGSFTFDPETSRNYEVNANWALYCDNYLEGFHVPYVHPGLAKELDYESYTTELLPLGVLQVGIGQTGESVFTLPEDHVDCGRHVSAYYYWLFPTTMLNFYPWGLSVNVVIPMGPSRTRVAFLSYVGDKTKRAIGAGASLHQVEMEDEAVVQSVARGLRSSLYNRGRYSPTRETGVHHFHRLLARFLAQTE